MERTSAIIKVQPTSFVSALFWLQCPALPSWTWTAANIDIILASLLSVKEHFQWSVDQSPVPTIAIQVKVEPTKITVDKNEWHHGK